MFFVAHRARKALFALLLLLLLLSGIFTRGSQAAVPEAVSAVTLSVGDLAIVGYNSDTDDFAMLALADIPGGSVIFITDRGWEGSSLRALSGLETVTTWTVVAGGVSAGTILRIDRDTPHFLDGGSHGSLVGAGSFDTGSGDQVLIYQTADNNSESAPTFITAFNGNDQTGLGGTDTTPADGWQDSGGSAGNQHSQLPSGLTADVHAYGHSTALGEVDNYVYNGPVTAASQADWLTRIGTSANWTSDNGGINSGGYDLSAAAGALPASGGFTVSGGATCIDSAQSGLWASGATWVGGTAPTIADIACVKTGHTVTLGANAAADQLEIDAGGTLDLATFALSVESSVTNNGTMRQTATVGANSTVNFLQIQPNGGGADRYLGMDITTGVGVDLGATEVAVRGNTSVCNGTGNGGAYNSRCFFANTANSGTATITLHFVASEDTLADEAFFQHASGLTWNEGAACANGVGVGGTCTGTGVFASPAWFLVGSQASDPTAVTLLGTDVSSNNTNTMVWFAFGALIFVTLTFVGRRRLFQA